VKLRGEVEASTSWLGQCPEHANRVSSIGTESYGMDLCRHALAVLQSSRVSLYRTRTGALIQPSSELSGCDEQAPRRALLRVHGISTHAYDGASVLYSDLALKRIAGKHEMTELSKPSLGLEARLLPRESS